jgi:hypothetical protein
LFIASGISVLLGWTKFNKAEVIIEWTTASELDTAGFNIYRSQQKTDPFILINQSLIPPSNDPLTGGDYTYSDTNVTPGKIYYYQLEEIETNGSTTRFEPIEVLARGGGRIELTLGLILAFFGIIGFYYSLNTKRKSKKVGSVGFVKPNRDSLVIEIAGIPLEVTSEDVAIMHLVHQRYRMFAGKSITPYQLTVEYAGDMPSFSSTFQSIRYADRSVIMNTENARGIFDFDSRSGVLRLAGNQTYEEPIDYFIRMIYARLAFHAGGLLFHAAGVVIDGKAYLFFGPSGSGKTTVSRLSAALGNILNDDLLIILPEQDRWIAHATPFWNPSQVSPSKGSARIIGFYRLVQDKQVSISMMDPGAALAEVLACVPLLPMQEGYSELALMRCEQLIKNTPVYALHFLPDASFWNCITERNCKDLT